MLRLLARVCHGALDHADYFVTLARLRVLDWFAGPEPETEADLRRQAERERLHKAFPKVDFDDPTPRRCRSDLRPTRRD
jgi:hypothetical protein